MKLKQHLIVFSVLIAIHLSCKAQEMHILSSKILPANDTVWVFKPAKYDAEKNYSIVYLLHGWSGNYKQWNDIAQLQKYADLYNFVIVCPDGFYDSWYLNSPFQSNWQYKTYFIDELIPYIDAKYKRTNSLVFISGLSMGGHGAINLFIEKQEYFAAAGSTSGALDLEARKVNLGLQRLLGKYENNALAWKENSAYANLDKLKDLTKPIFIDCGVADGFFEMNKKFVEKAMTLKIPVYFQYSPGAHNYDYWRQSIAQQFAFFNRISNK
jgi:S-formylglutathione hydrolase FrmB